MIQRSNCSGRARRVEGTAAGLVNRVAVVVAMNAAIIDRTLI
jgi:hypothetical protein